MLPAVGFAGWGKVLPALGTSLWTPCHHNHSHRYGLNRMSFGDTMLAAQPALKLPALQSPNSLHVLRNMGLNHSVNSVLKFPVVVQGNQLLNHGNRLLG